MHASEILQYFGHGALYAAIASLVLWPARRSWRWTAALYPALFFLFLTQHPFPDRARLDCSDGGMPAILVPFTTIDHLVQMRAAGLEVTEILSSLVVQAAAMNFVLCLLAGASMAGFGLIRRRPTALLFGTGLSLLAELSQLTGLFGIYPCAYRQFDLDDLILNILGVLAGDALMRAVRALQRQKRGQGIT